MRFIQVGAGGFGNVWLRALPRNRTASLAALVDVDEAVLKSAAEQVGLPAECCFSDYGQAFARVKADAVLCVTPPPVHCDVALAAFEHGLHVLTEKPLADTMPSALRMVAGAEAAGRTLMVSQNYRFRSWVRTMRYLVESGQFGAADNVLVRFARAPRFEGSFRLKMEHPLVMDMSIHHFDLMRAVTGREPVSVYATTWKPSWSWFEHDPCAVAVFEFEGGLKVIYDGSWVARGRETTWDGDWRVECPQAVLELRGEEVHITPADHPEQDGTIFLQKMPCEGQDFSLLEFQQAVMEGRQPETSGRDNLGSLAMVFAATESARRGEPVRIDEIVS
jgi:predicted dehydrogenase